MSDVYVAACLECGLVKIGLSRDPESRMGGIQCPRPGHIGVDLMATHPGSRTVERLLHHRYADVRFFEPRHVARGRITDGQREWFDLDDEDLADLLELFEP